MLIRICRLFDAMVDRRRQRCLAATIVVGVTIAWAGSGSSFNVAAGESEKPGAERPKDKVEATELGKFAAGMKPGTWAELKTEGYTADLLKVQNHHILEYTGA